MKFLCWILPLFILLFSFQLKNRRIARMNTPSSPFETIKTIPQFINFNDTISGDTLLIHLAANNIPVNYSRKLVTGVCTEGKCRSVNIELFWSITGRYLGFELPNGESLSKTEHLNFNSEDYNRLHEILSNPLSPLANYSLSDLVPLAKNPADSVDAVSSATLSSITDYVVDSAVYTTYTLWHIVYGATKREVEKLTGRTLTSEIAAGILAGNNSEDIRWILNHIRDSMEISPELTTKLMALIAGNDLSLSENSLNVLPQNLSTDIQFQLYSIFKNSGFLKQRLILQKFKDAGSLDTGMLLLIAAKLQEMPGSLVVRALQIFKNQPTENEQITYYISGLLSNENRFVANEAFQYLNEKNIQDKKILRKIDRYKKSKKAD